MIGNSRVLCLAIAHHSTFFHDKTIECFVPLSNFNNVARGGFLLFQRWVKRQIQGPLQPSLIFHVFSETREQHLLR